MPYAYILLCSDKTYYVGSTWDIKHRLGQHKAGEGANYTKNRLPVKLLYYEEYESIAHAYWREKKIHGWSRGKKRVLIRDGWGVRVQDDSKLFE